MVHLFVPRLSIDREQLVYQFNCADGRGILFIEFDRIHEVPSGVAPAGRMHHLRTAHAIICGVAICLEKSFEVAEEVQWALAFAAHAEIKNRHAARRPVLPEVSLMVCAASVVCLYIDRSFIRLDVGAGKQLVPHRSGYRHQHLSDGHHPAAHRSPADIDARVTQ